MDNKYDLVRSHIDFIRQGLRETSDDTNTTDEQIYMALIEARGLIMERRLEKNKDYPETSYQTICMELCVDTYHECGPCIPDYGCVVLKTKNEIPDGLFDGNTEIQRVSTLVGKEISPVTESQHNLRQYRKTGKNNYYYVKTNKKIALFNIPNNNLRIVKVRGLFVDPVAAQLASFCNESEDGSCIRVFDAVFGSKVSERMAIRAEVMKQLLGTKQIPEDRANDAASTPLNQIY